MNYYVYVLLSQRDKRLYIGMTSNLRNRVSQHNNGQVKSTKYRGPLIIIHYEAFIDRRDAAAREVYLKSGYGHDQLRVILQNYFRDN